MFRNAAEKRIVREADRIVSMKENVDALSWGRVLAIGKELQRGFPDGAQADLARELIGIAQSNISLTSRLGIESHPADDQVMASGVEVVEGGLAEAALLERHAPSFAGDGDGRTEPLPEVIRSADAPPAHDGDVAETFDGDGGYGPDVRSVTGFGEPFDFRPDFEPDEGVAVNRFISSTHAETHGVPDDVVPGPTAEGQRSVDEATSEPPCDHEETSAKAKFARFCSLYESRDGSLCLFEDEQGHLVAVDASKLA